MTNNKIDIIKSPNDKCKYDYFELNNKLNVFIVEDSDVDIDCVALVVNIGYLYDTVAGIAHFLEHMLFNGTKKYPNENEFMNYVSENGGSSNAYTAHDHTCYFYTVNSNVIIKSIDIFSDFFIDPLLSKDAVDREKEAVDAEHKKNMANDMWRFNDILRKVCLETHPLTKFGTGSSKSLDIPNIHKKVKDFFDTYYSADLMTVVIVTKQNISTIKNKIINILEKIPIRNNKLNKIKYSGKIFDSPKLIKICPIKDIKKITIYWEIPSFHTTPMKSPIQFICHLLGNESKDSLYYILMKNSYINEISCGIFLTLIDKTIIHLDVTLTDYGFKKKEYILNFINSYIIFLKNSLETEHMEKLFNEYQIINAFNFKYQTKQSSENKALELCSHFNQYKFNIKNILLIEHAYENYKPNIMNNLKKAFEPMNINNAIIIFCSRIYEKFDYNISEEYETKYLLTTYDDYKKIKYDFNLQSTNKYISTSEKLININFKIPQKIDTTNIMAFWFPTNIYNTINVSIEAKINLPLSVLDVKTNTILLLYFNSILNEINHEKYLCNIANYSINVQLVMGKLYISIYGNSNKIHKVCKLIIDSFFNSELINENSFNNAKNLLELTDVNNKYDAPYVKVGTFFNKIMHLNYYDYNDRLKIIDNIKLDSVKSIFNEIIKMNDVTLLVSGNSDKNLTNKIINIFERFNSQNVYKYDDFVFDKHKNINKCETIYLKDQENIHENNKAVNYYIYISKIKLGKINDWYMHTCLLNILNKIISLDYFDTLRTKEKFGYIAGGSVFTTGDKKYLTKYYSFLVQSPNKSIDEIIKRTDKFIIEFNTKLKNIEVDKIQNIINSLISIIESPFNNLIEHSHFIFNQEIECKIFDFNSRQMLISIYKTITKDDLLKFYNDKFINKKNVIFGI